MLVLIFDWLEQTDKIGWNILPARMTCAELCCQIDWEHLLQLCVNFYGFADLCTCNNWCDETYFFGFWFPQGEGGGSCVRGHGLLSLHSSYTLNSSKNSIFFVSNTNLCRAMLLNYLKTYSSAFCQTRALEKAFKKQNNGQSVTKILVLNVNACI